MSVSIGSGLPSAVPPMPSDFWDRVARIVAERILASGGQWQHGAGGDSIRASGSNSATDVAAMTLRPVGLAR
jgi:hypothetical protein